MTLIPARPASAIECSPHVGPLITDSPCCPVYTGDYASRVPVPPALPAGSPATPTGAFDVPFDCTQRLTGDHSCAPNLALVPNATREQGKLFLWLPGLYTGPDANEHILYMAAYAGFDTLAVSWDTQSPTSVRCGDATGFATCDPTDDCADIMHRELWTGVDDAATPDDPGFFVGQTFFPLGYTGRYWSSVERRATRALQALHEADTTQAHHWADYCEPDDTYGSKLRYEDVVMAGGSMGAAQAQWVYYTRSVDALEQHVEAYGSTGDTGLPLTPPPPIAVHGLWGTEVFGDFCDVTAPVPTDTQGRPSPYYYDVWDPNGYATSTLRIKPRGKAFAALHAQSENWPNQNHGYPGYTDLPLPFEALAIGDENDVWDYEDTGQLVLGNDTILVTDQLPVAGRAAHPSMMTDEAMPDGPTSEQDVPTPGADTHTVHLFHGYVDGMCAVGAIQ